MMPLKHLFLLSTLFFISSCSLLSPIQGQKNNAYLLSNTPTLSAKKHYKNVTLFITLPDTRPIYNTTQMAYTNRPYQINYFGENQWAETPSQMLLPLILQTLQSTHDFKAVVSAPYVGRYNYIISTQVLKLEQNLLTPRGRLEFSARVQIINATTNQVTAIKQFNITVPMHQRTPFGGVVAANQATEAFLREMTLFILRNV